MGAEVSLGEGNTPCVPSRRIGPAAGLRRLWFKLETGNPTGSYKDRFAAAAVSGMVARGVGDCWATSSGNTGAALAAYCAAAGIRCRIAVVETAPAEKLFQMRAYGAEVFRVRGFGVDAGVTDRVFARLREVGQAPGASLQISAYAWSPEGMRGVESLAEELPGQVPGGPDAVFCPAGGGGLALAVCRGSARGARTVAVHCVQPEGNDTIATPLREGAEAARAVACTTRISGLQVANVIDGHEVVRACRDSGGTGHIVSDDAVWAMQGRLAREEGIFCEPAGAVAVAGAIQAAERGELDADAAVVCVVTGIGFKDASAVVRMVGDGDVAWRDVGEIG
jgi:threonine synthase